QITIHLQRVWQVPQSDELYDKLNQIKQILVTRGFNNNMVGKGSLMYPCYADFDNSYVINYNGDVFKCTARDFKEKERIGVLNNDGIITFNSSFLERKSRRFLTPCKDCKALPICTICSQTKYESINNNICPYGILDKDIDDQIYFRYKALLSGK
ncbi:MAG: SPASM domain-containing protein, partial [Bacteroidales bacterium]